MIWYTSDEFDRLLDPHGKLLEEHDDTPAWLDFPTLEEILERDREDHPRWMQA